MDDPPIVRAGKSFAEPPVDHRARQILERNGALESVGVGGSRFRSSSTSAPTPPSPPLSTSRPPLSRPPDIGSASLRDRVCQYVSIEGGGVTTQTIHGTIKK